MVRCVRCGGEWVAQEVYVPEVGAPEADAREAGTLGPGPPPVSADAFAAQAAEWHAPPAMTAMDRLAATAPLPRRSVGLTAAWILTLFVLVAGIACVHRMARGVRASLAAEQSRARVPRGACHGDPGSHDTSLPPNHGRNRETNRRKSHNCLFFHPVTPQLWQNFASFR